MKISGILAEPSSAAIYIKLFDHQSHLVLALIYGIDNYTQQLKQSSFEANLFRMPPETFAIEKMRNNVAIISASLQPRRSSIRLLYLK